jgi:hypothetical protein
MIIQSRIKSRKFLKVRETLSISISLLLVIFSQSCRNEMVGQYIGIDETRTDEIILNLKADYSFKMDLIEDGNFKNEPQETLVGVWEKDGNQLKLITKDNKIIYEQVFEEMTIAGKSIKLETYVFKICEKDFFASNFNFFKDRNVEKDK